MSPQRAGNGERRNGSSGQAWRAADSEKSREGDGARVLIGVVRASPGDVGSSLCVAKVWVCGAVWKFRWKFGKCGHVISRVWCHICATVHGDSVAFKLGFIIVNSDKFGTIL